MWCLGSEMVCKTLIRSVSATCLPRRRRLSVSTNQPVGELGDTLFASLQSNPNPIPKSQQQQKQEGEETQISGSDVLWALQRASARKKKKRNKQEHGRGSTSLATRIEESAVDYSNVRPLRIKAHWGANLDELEKRLRDLSDTI